MGVCTFLISSWRLSVKASPLILLFLFKILQLSWASQLSLFNLLYLRIKVQDQNFNIPVAGCNLRKSQKGEVQRAKCGDLCSVTGHAQLGAATTHKQCWSLTLFLPIYINPIILCSKKLVLKSVYSFFYTNLAFFIWQLATIKTFHPGLKCELLPKSCLNQ